MGSDIVKEGYSDYKTQHYAQWQVVAFMLPATQQEATGWWDALPWLCRLSPQDFMPITNAYSPKNFWVMRQEYTLALAWVLQACAKESRVPTGVLCDTVWELQRCMVLLMTLSGDDIAKASLLKSTEEECWTSPTSEEETILLGKGIKLPQVLGSLSEWMEIPEFIEPAKQIIMPSASSPSPMPQPSCLPPGKAKKSQQGMEANPNNPGRWVHIYLQEHDRVLEWEREFWSLLCSMDECLGDIQVQGLVHQQATAFRLPAAQLEKDSWLTAPPYLGVLGYRDYLPQKDFKGTWDYWEVQHEEMVALTMGLLRCTICSGMPQGCSVGSAIAP